MLYTPGEICKKIDGLTVRVIADLAEKGFILPAKDTSGPGTSRLYDKDGIFKIMLYAALRGGLPRDVQTNIINKIIDAAKENKYIIFYYGNPESGDGVDSYKVFMSDKPDKELYMFKSMFDPGVENNPKGYVHTVINLEGMRTFIDKNFQ